MCRLQFQQSLPGVISWLSRAAINGSQATGVFGLSVKLKINFISERTGTGGGREGGRVESGGRQLGISQAGFVLPSPSVPLT